MNFIEIDIIQHRVAGLRGPTDLAGLDTLFGDRIKTRNDGISERWYYTSALVDIDPINQSIDLIDFLPGSSIQIFGRDPFRDIFVLNKLITISKDLEFQQPGNYYYFYDLMVSLSFEPSGDLSESTFGFFWNNMPERETF